MYCNKRGRSTTKTAKNTCIPKICFFSHASPSPSRPSKYLPLVLVDSCIQECRDSRSFCVARFAPSLLRKVVVCGALVVLYSALTVVSSSLLQKHHPKRPTQQHGHKAPGPTTDLPLRRNHSATLSYSSFQRQTNKPTTFPCWLGTRTKVSLSCSKPCCSVLLGL